MTPEVVAHSKTPAPEPLVLYATRFARKCLLEHLCPPDHPVLDVEYRLIEEARQRLHTYLLQNGWNRGEVEKRIRQCASIKAIDMTEDEVVRKLVVAIIHSKSIDDAFPNVD